MNNDEQKSNSGRIANLPEFIKKMLKDLAARLNGQTMKNDEHESNSGRIANLPEFIKKMLKDLAARLNDKR